MCVKPGKDKYHFLHRKTNEINRQAEVKEQLCGGMTRNQCLKKFQQQQQSSGIKRI